MNALFIIRDSVLVQVLWRLVGGFKVREFSI